MVDSLNLLCKTVKLENCVQLSFFFELLFKKQETLPRLFVVRPEALYISRHRRPFVPASGPLPTIQLSFADLPLPRVISATAKQAKKQSMSKRSEFAAVNNQRRTSLFVPNDPLRVLLLVKRGEWAILELDKPLLLLLGLIW